MSDITEEDVMKYCNSRNLMLVAKESLEYMHRPIVIENAPTVKAIPIETIKKEIERLKEDIKWAWYYGNTALEKMEYLERWLEIKLEDWEKENEQTN